MSDEPDIDRLLMRSAELDKALSELPGLDIGSAPDRVIAAWTMCGVVFGHAESIKILFASRKCTSAFALLRLQYEALVRAMWLLYSASDQWFSTLLRDATPEGAEKANKLPSASEMIKALEGKAPPAAMDDILGFRAQSWKPLCSFVHAGFHALHRHGGGYPVKLVSDVIKSSNGLSTMAGMLVVMLIRNDSWRDRIPEMQREFADCLPPLKTGQPQAGGA